MFRGGVLHDVLQVDDGGRQVGGDGLQAEVEVVRYLLTDGLEEEEDGVGGWGPAALPHHHHGSPALHPVSPHISGHSGVSPSPSQSDPTS